MIYESRPTLLFSLAFFGFAVINSIDLTFAFLENSNWQKFTPDQVVDFKPGCVLVIVSFKQFDEILIDLGLQLVLFD